MKLSALSVGSFCEEETVNIALVAAEVSRVSAFLIGMVTSVVDVPFDLSGAML